MCDEMRRQIPKGLRKTGGSFPRAECSHDAVWRNARKMINLESRRSGRGCIIRIGSDQTLILSSISRRSLALISLMNSPSHQETCTQSESNFSQSHMAYKICTSTSSIRNCAYFGSAIVAIVTCSTDIPSIPCVWTRIGAPLPARLSSFIVDHNSTQLSRRQDESRGEGRDTTRSGKALLCYGEVTGLAHAHTS